jgi:hypothetical protein
MCLGQMSLDQISSDEMSLEYSSLKPISLEKCLLGFQTKSTRAMAVMNYKSIEHKGTASKNNVFRQKVLEPIKNL